MTVSLACKDIHKTYHIGRNAIPVLRGVNMEVRQGECVAVTGLSGAGKSTLLHVAGGLDHPDKGTVTVAGIEIYGVPGSTRTRARASKIGFIFQSYNLLCEMDIMENVMLPAMALPTSREHDADPKAKALALLDSVGLSDRTRHTPLELSGGEQQRVAVVRALMNDPELILADEPTGNLDAATGDSVMDCLFKLARKNNSAMVIVTHNERTASRSDSVYRLDNGILTRA